MLSVFGIRHHGPGSARRLRSALEELQPDIILLEGVEEGAELWSAVGTELLRPPVALLIYEPKEFRQAVYYPFAEFSPEWQCLSWANAQGKMVLPMDLPQAYRLDPSFPAHRQQAELAFEEEQGSRAEWEEDPLGFLAKLAGYSDYERWWELHFEQLDADIAVFEQIAELIGALRETKAQISKEDLLREAYMRKVLRKTQKDYPNAHIAVVCGAWHIPALQNYQDYKAKDDTALLRGLKKIKLKASWVPWTLGRLSMRSGYGAGVQAPAWYALLFARPHDALAYFLSQAAALLRQAEQAVDGSAAVLEAVRLAQSLASLRGRELAGIEEIAEAAQTVLCGAIESRWQLVEEELLRGKGMGEVHSSLARLPLQIDFDAQVKSLRLKKYLEEKAWLKATSQKPQGGLDLREDFDRQQSQFLYRLLCIGLPWGELQEATGRELSSKNEYWLMNWQPEYQLKLIEASTWGNTIEEAASRLLVEEAQQEQSLPALSAVFRRALYARLPQAFPFVLKELQDAVALSQDSLDLLRVLPLLLRIQRYGDLQLSQPEALASLVDLLLPRVLSSLPLAAAQLREEAEQDFLFALRQAQQALVLSQRSEWKQLWVQALQQLAERPETAPALQGLAWRLRFDMGLLSSEELEKGFAFALSPAQEYRYSARWLDGFLGDSALLLLHQPKLHYLLDTWVDGLKPERFTEVLPLLRRCFSQFAENEKKQLLALAKKELGAALQKQEEVAEGRGSPALQKRYALLSKGLAAYVFS